VEKVIIIPKAAEYLDSLVITLHKKEYFGFKESAKEYVDNLLNYIYDELPNAHYKLLPNRLKSYGSYYVTYRTNKRTAWYIFFIKKESRYIVLYITNNHIAKAAFLNGL
jgi:hypothetical protein